MLPRRSRLSRHTFPSSKAGMRASTPHFSLVWGQSRSGGIAAVISKKVARRSVDRHLLKRRMLEIARSYASGDRFIVLYAKTGSPGLSFSAIKEELTSLLIRTTLHPTHL